MDEPGASGADLEQALAELAWINRILGGTQATLSALGQIDLRARIDILDIGTGAADIPVALVEWGRERGVEVRVVGVDFNPAVCAWAAGRVAAYPQIEIRQADVFALELPPASFDLVHCALFLHHFPQAMAAGLLRRFYLWSRRGLIVNDLHRHPGAFYPVKWGAALLSQSRMVQHDGPLSVLRGFGQKDVEELARLSGVPLALSWHWAFRWVMMALK